MTPLVGGSGSVGSTTAGGGAFTTAAVALANGASSIVMVRLVEEALALRETGIGQICMGEVRGQAPDGFDFGNSPFEISTDPATGFTIRERVRASDPRRQNMLQELLRPLTQDAEKRSAADHTPTLRRMSRPA